MRAITYSSLFSISSLSASFSGNTSNDPDFYENSVYDRNLLGFEDYTDENGNRAVRHCNQKLLPNLWDPHAKWFCRGNSCGVACPGNILHKNLYWCNHREFWENVSKEFTDVRRIECEIFSDFPDYEDMREPPKCGLDNAPGPALEGPKDENFPNKLKDMGIWNCDNKFKKCQLQCDNQWDKSKTKLVCNPQKKTWRIIGKNSCTPPAPKVCDHAKAINSSNFFKYGTVECLKGKSCSLQCNDMTIQGALTCKKGEWVKRKKHHSCCLNEDKPNVNFGIWRCKEKKYSHRCQLTCTNGVKPRTSMTCEGDGWQTYGRLSCQK